VAGVRQLFSKVAVADGFGSVLLNCRCCESVCFG
jgi:hypothetical protein